MRAHSVFAERRARCQAIELLQRAITGRAVFRVVPLGLGAGARDAPHGDQLIGDGFTFGAAVGAAADRGRDDETDCDDEAHRFTVPERVQSQQPLPACDGREAAWPTRIGGVRKSEPMSPASPLGFLLVKARPVRFDLVAPPAGLLA